MTEYVTQNIRTVLKTYQSSATKSLQGPGQSLVAAAAVAAGAVSPPTIIKKEILSSPEPLDVNESPTLVVQPPPPPELPQPILTVADTGRGELYETRLEGKTIGCFSLGGELRLCLPQFLNNVLADFTLDQINRIFDELGIFCSQCTPDQLMEFKAAKILPSDVKASGLITRTDAERLCAALLHRSADRHQYAVDDIPKGAISFKVYHRCFGKCEGICTPDMYSYMKPACIMCIECKGWFSPQKFVGHVHRRQENRTCHWGFDSRSWHDYLHVALDVENREKYTKMLDELKELERKETLKAQRDLSYLKRKAELEEVTIPAPPCKREPIDIPSKKVKSLDEAPAYQLDYQSYQRALIYHCAAHQQQQQQRGQISAFRPWAPKTFLPLGYNSVPLPYLSQEPPVLQNPERVVRNTESERFERTYQPNVALAPRKVILSKEREKERERERERDLDRQQTQHAAITNLCEAELHIKQERPTSPDDLAQSPEDIRMPSPSPHNNNNTNKSNNNNLNNNRRHSMHSPPPPPSSSQLHLRHLHHTPPQSISPEEFSGSNEITSSTSPIPNSNTSPNNIQQHLQHLQLQQSFHQHHAATHQQHRIHHQHPHQHHQSPHHHPHQSQSIIATVNQHSKLLTTADNNNILCLPSRIRISKNLINQSNIVRSPTPPPLPPSAANHEQYLASSKRQQQHLHHHIQQQSPSQSSASLSSSSLSVQATGAAAVNLVTTGSAAGHDSAITAVTNVAAAAAAGVLVKHHAHLNGGGVGIVGNSEFELSTDTDDDSLNGEPDSQSNILAPWELAADALKDTRPKDREKILQLLQKLLHDNKKMRCDCIQLIEEVRKRDEQICDLQQELQHYRRQVAQSPAIAHQKVNSSCSNSSTSSNTSSSSTCSTGSVIAKIDSCTTSQTESTVPGAAPTASSSSSSSLSSSYQQESQPIKNEIEKIKVPLKKSSRRSPEDTVVVLNQTTIGTSSTSTNGDDSTSTTAQSVAAVEIKIESKQMPNSVNTTNGETPPKPNSPPNASASAAQSSAPTSSTSPTTDSTENAGGLNDDSHTNTKTSTSSLAPSPTSPSSSSSSSSSATSLSSVSSSPATPPSSGIVIKAEK